MPSLTKNSLTWSLNKGLFTLVINPDGAVFSSSCKPLPSPIKITTKNRITIFWDRKHLFHCRDMPVLKSAIGYSNSEDFCFGIYSGSPSEASDWSLGFIFDFFNYFIFVICMFTFSYRKQKLFSIVASQSYVLSLWVILVDETWRWQESWKLDWCCIAVWCAYTGDWSTCVWIHDLLCYLLTISKYLKV